MPSMPWIKLYTEMLDDPKLGQMDPIEKWRFVALCLMAGECDAEGYLVNGQQPFTVEEIAWRLRENPAQMGASMEVLTDAGLITQEDDCWIVVNFAKRQGRSQSEKRRQWRERKQRQRDGERDIEQRPKDVTRDTDESHAGVTVTEESREDKTREEGEEREIAATAAPPPPPEQPAPKQPRPRPTTNRAPPLTDGQRGFLEKHGAKRFKNREQAGAVLALEKEFGTPVLLEGASWTAKKGMTLGNALISLESALPNWGKPKKKGNGGGSRASPTGAPEPKGYAGIREWIEEEGGEWQDVKP